VHAAASPLSDERDREQSLNTRAVAVAAAAVVLMSLLGVPPVVMAEEFLNGCAGDAQALR
jgi:hypothetical protein